MFSSLALVQKNISLRTENISHILIFFHTKFHHSLFSPSDISMGNFGEADQYWWLPFGQIKVMSGHIGAISRIGAFFYVGLLGIGLNLVTAR